jgi:large subunit ribosomal protein L15
MNTLATLQNSSRGLKKSKRLGRGTGSGKGKTCGRGTKGQGARSGYKRRYGFEGGQVPLYRKLPTRGFTRGRFLIDVCTVNLGQLDGIFADGDVVNVESLKERGFFSGPVKVFKILGDGELSKKVTIEADAFSKSAIAKLDAAEIKYSTRAGA